jgi:AcrR family transcriptional regulator
MAGGGTRTYRGLSAVDRDADRRARLLVAGLEVFGTTGYATSTIEALCTRAGVTARNFYDHFTGREALLRAVYDESVELHVAAVADALDDADDDLEQVVRRALEAAVRAVADDPRRARIMQLQSVGVTEEFEQHRLEVVERYAALIVSSADALVQRGALPPRDRHLTALALVGAMSQLVVWWLGRDPTPPTQPLVDELVRLFTHALP